MSFFCDVHEICDGHATMTVMSVVFWMDLRTVMPVMTVLSMMLR
jgi:hypothetical protein